MPHFTRALYYGNLEGLTGNELSVEVLDLHRFNMNEGRFYYPNYRIQLVFMQPLELP